MGRCVVRHSDKGRQQYYIHATIHTIYKLGKATVIWCGWQPDESVLTSYLHFDVSSQATCHITEVWAYIILCDVGNTQLFGSGIYNMGEVVVDIALEAEVDISWSGVSAFISQSAVPQERLTYEPVENLRRRRRSWSSTKPIVSMKLITFTQNKAHDSIIGQIIP